MAGDGEENAEGRKPTEVVQEVQLEMEWARQPTALNAVF